MKETYVDFSQLDVNPRIINAAKQYGLLSSEGILYGSSRHFKAGRQLSSSDHSALVAAVAAQHCPQHQTGFDLLQRELNSTTKAITEHTVQQEKPDLHIKQKEKQNITSNHQNKLINKAVTDVQLDNLNNLPAKTSTAAEESSSSSIPLVSRILTSDQRPIKKKDSRFINKSQSSNALETIPTILPLFNLQTNSIHSINRNTLNNDNNLSPNLESPLQQSADSGIAAVKSCAPRSNVPRSNDSIKHPQEDLFAPIICSSLTPLFSRGSVLEVCGESSTGKTQLALTLALKVALPTAAGGLGSKVAYLCTEGQFPSARLQQLVAAVQHPQQHSRVADSIYVQHIADLQSLLNCVRYQLPPLLQKEKVSLVVLDSVAAPFRVLGKEVKWTDRQHLLNTLGCALRAIAAKHHCLVLALNQVTARCERLDLYGMGAGTSVTPALGLAWSNLVTSRVMLHRTVLSVPATVVCGAALQRTRTGSGDETRFKNSDVLLKVRLLRVVFCPWLPRLELPYVVVAAGVAGISDAKQIQTDPDHSWQ